MNLLYSIEEEKNIWGYDSNVGIISKSDSSEEKDKEQDSRIDELTRRLNQNIAEDVIQQGQIDTNRNDIDDTVTRLNQNIEEDVAQQGQIDANRGEIDETVRRLNENIAEDGVQQGQIDSNSANIIRVEGELPTLDMEGTTLVVGKRGGS